MDVWKSLTTDKPDALVVTPEDDVALVYQIHNPIKLTDPATKKVFTFDVFPNRKSKPFTDWFECHTQEFLKVLCSHFCNKNLASMLATDRSNSQYWCKVLSKYVRSRSTNQVLWLNMDDSFRT